MSLVDTYRCIYSNREEKPTSHVPQNYVSTRGGCVFIDIVFHCFVVPHDKYRAEKWRRSEYKKNIKLSSCTHRFSDKCSDSNT